MRVLITGGKGFIGAWIARRLLARDMTLRIFDTLDARSLVEAVAGSRARVS
jgi:UDP-glucose 4-epimerase